MKQIATLTTPPAVANFPYLNEADTKFKASGLYQTDLILDPDNDETHAAFMEKVNSLLEESKEIAVAKLEKQGGKGKAKLKKLKAAEFFKPEFDDDGNETGRYTMKVKQDKVINYTDKKTGRERTITVEKLKIFDAAGNLLKNAPLIYGGSILQVNSPVFAYFNEKDVECGVTFKISAVRVVKLRTGGGSDNAEDYGFATDGDGYVADTFEGDEEDYTGDEEDYTGDAEDYTGDEEEGDF